MTSREKMKNEAIRRMRMLNIIPQTIKEFEIEDKLNKSTHNGILFWLNDEEMKIVKDFEERFNACVYHAVETNFKMCDGEIMKCFDLLYVSEDVDEWSSDRAYLKEDNFMYVFSKSNFCEDGEIGGIQVHSLNGGVIRTA